jgi:hypothetical protein
MQRGESGEVRGERKDDTMPQQGVAAASQCGGRLNNFPVLVSAAELRPLSVSLYRGPTIFPAFSGTLGPSSTDDSTIFQFFITVTILVFPRQP